MNIVRKWQLTQMMSLPQIQVGGTQFIASVKMGGTQFIASETGRSGRIKMRPSRTPLPHLPFVICEQLCQLSFVNNQVS